MLQSKVLDKKIEYPCRVYLLAVCSFHLNCFMFFVCIYVETKAFDLCFSECKSRAFFVFGYPREEA